MARRALSLREGVSAELRASLRSIQIAQLHRIFSNELGQFLLSLAAASALSEFSIDLIAGRLVGCLEEVISLNKIVRNDALRKKLERFLKGFVIAV